MPMSPTVQDNRIKLQLCARSVEVELHNYKAAIRGNKKLKYVVLFREKRNCCDARDSCSYI
jgi:hypothetical protein